MYDLSFGMYLLYTSPPLPSPPLPPLPAPPQGPGSPPAPNGVQPEQGSAEEHLCHAESGRVEVP